MGLVSETNDESAPTVLIVDNNPMSINRLKNVFRVKNFNIEICEDGDQAVDDLEGARPFEDEFAHVRDVEQPDALADVLVLALDTGLVGHRHVPAPEVDNARAGGDVLLIERGSLVCGGQGGLLS